MNQHLCLLKIEEFSQHISWFSAMYGSLTAKAEILLQIFVDTQWHGYTTVAGMAKTTAAKMGLKEGSRAIFRNAPANALDAITIPELKIAKRLSGMFDYIHLFVTTEKDFIRQFPKLEAHLADKGMLWVSWPKNKQLDSDLTLKKVIKNSYNFGLVESTTISIDATWSAIKFTHPKKGKQYNNSYGKLPER